MVGKLAKVVRQAVKHKKRSGKRKAKIKKAKKSKKKRKKRRHKKSKKGKKPKRLIRKKATKKDIERMVRFSCVV